MPTPVQDGITITLLLARSAGQPIVTGWLYAWLAQLNFAHDSWTAPLDVQRVPAGGNAQAVDHLWIVDWDEVLIAPKKCDLMMGVSRLGNCSARRETSWFLNGYGETAVDRITQPVTAVARAFEDLGRMSNLC